MAHVEDLWVRGGERTARYGKGMRYRARYTAPDGRERCRSFPDKQKREAAAFAAAQETDVRRGTWADPDAGKVTLRRFAEDTYLPALTTNPSTQERIADQLRLHVLPSLGDTTLGQLAAHPSVVQAWLKGLKLAPGSARTVLSVLSGVLATALDDEMIARNPCRARSVKPPQGDGRKLIPWEASRVAAVRAALPGRYQALADCGSGLGMRQGEVFALSPDDIGWLRKTVHVRHQLKIVHRRLVIAPPKRGKDRGVPLPDSTALSLAAHIAKYPPVTVTLPWEVPDGKPVTVTLVFSTSTGRAVRRGDFNGRWVIARREAGVSDGRANGFHALRHHYASVLLAGGEDIRSLSAHLGHNDPSFTLRIYCHLMPGSGSRARRLIDEASAGAEDGLETDSGTDG